MSDYTPTTEQALGNEIARVRHGQDVTASDLANRLMPWLAAHDAEVRAQADSEIQTFREQYIPRLTDAEAALAEVRAGVVTEEPEWEYAVAREEWPSTPVYRRRDLEAAEAFLLNPPLGEKRHGWLIIKQRKAGPWVPVEEG